MARRVTGNKAYVKIGGNTIHVLGWEQTLEVDDEETTDTSAAGYRLVEPTLEKAQASVNCLLDMDSLPTGTLNLKPGVKAAIELHLGDPAVDNKAWTYTAMIKSVGVASQVKSIVKFTLSLMSDGTITHPA